MRKYKHLFFDLDRTLWDFERNTNEVFQEMYREYRLKNLGIVDFDYFLNTYHQINNDLWDQYRVGSIKKEVLREQRFADTLLAFGVDDKVLTGAMADYYVTQSALKRHLFPYTLELLEALKPKYSLYIITNGFEEVQAKKLHSSGLHRYFQQVITSERAGKKKPDRHIFEYALQMASAQCAESIMIGDDLEVDIEGAAKAGIDQVYVNYRNLPLPHGIEPTYVVPDLKAVGEILLDGKYL